MFFHGNQRLRSEILLPDDGREKAHERQGKKRRDELALDEEEDGTRGERIRVGGEAVRHPQMYTHTTNAEADGLFCRSFSLPSYLTGRK